VEKLEDSFGFIKAMPKPLAAYLFTNNRKLENKFIQNVSAGGILINDIALHVSHPFILVFLFVMKLFHSLFWQQVPGVV
jgi:aldehyde dehydrogenase (NAD+)